MEVWIALTILVDAGDFLPCVLPILDKKVISTLPIFFNGFAEKLLTTATACGIIVFFGRFLVLGNFVGFVMLKHGHSRL